MGRIFRGRPPLALDEALRVLGVALAAGAAAPPVLLCFASERSLYESPREAVAKEKVRGCKYNIYGPVKPAELTLRLPIFQARGYTAQEPSSFGLQCVLCCR